MFDQHRQLIANRDYDDSGELTAPQLQQRDTLIRGTCGRELHVTTY